MILLSICFVLLILIIIWMIINVYYEGFVSCEPRTATASNNSYTLSCGENKYLSQLQPKQNNEYSFTCCTDDTGNMQGLQGPRGDPGAKGAIGDVGPQGLVGDIGPEGNKGNTGTQGPQGQDGINGERGPTGDTGPQGEIGPIGPAGAVEITGTKNVDPPITGPKGPQGKKGPRGPIGPKGEDAAPTIEPKSGSEKLKEIQLQLIKILASKPPRKQKLVIYNEVDDEGNNEGNDEGNDEDITPSCAQGSEYCGSTYKQCST